MTGKILHPPKGCGDLTTLWFRYFDEAAHSLTHYHPDDQLSPRQAAHALGMRQSTLFEITRFDKGVPLEKRVGPAFIEARKEDTTFRPVAMYRVSDLAAWVKRLSDERRTIYGERIEGGRGNKHLPNLSRMISLSEGNTTKAEKIAGRFLLRVSADLADTIAQHIADGVSRRLTEQALKEALPDPGAMEITDAPLDTGFIKTVDNLPDIQWPLSDPRVTGRSISQAQFILALKALGMNPGQFAEFWGVASRTAYAWANGDIPVPLGVADYLKYVIGQFVRLRCIQLGVPAPITAIDSLPLTDRTDSLNALDTLRAMVAEENPDGRGHEQALSQPPGRRNSNRGFKRKREPLTPRPEIVDPVEPPSQHQPDA